MFKAKAQQPQSPHSNAATAALLMLKQQQLDAVREMFTLQEQLFTGMADTQEQTAVYLAELVTQVRPDPSLRRK